MLPKGKTVTSESKKTFAERIGGLGTWRLVGISIAMSIGITSLMSLIFHGRITYDYLATAVVAGGLVSTIVLGLIQAYSTQLRIAGRELEATNRRLVAEQAERLTTEKRLLLTERASTLGTMAAGIAHEINNPLACVVNNLQWVLAREEVLERLDPDSVAAMSEALDGSQRIAKIVGDMKRLSGAEDKPVAAVNITTILKNSIRTLDSQLRYSARLECQHDEFWVIGDDGRLTQVLINVLLNAAQACDAAPRSEHVITTRIERAPDDRVRVIISDTGVGMSQDVIDKIFDPFFSTKPIGRGTGLGLSISHNLLASMGGAIEAESELGRGTTMVITLSGAPPAQSAVAASAGIEKRQPQTAKAPIAEPMPEAKTTDADGAAKAGVRATTRRILIIDDDVNVANVLARFLDGDEVTTVYSGQEGIAKLAQHEYDLVFCDLDVHPV